MILVDTALEKREAEGNPIRVGMIGAGFMGKPIALQIIKYTKGMRLVAIANRHIEKAKQAYLDAGASQVETVTSQLELDSAIEKNTYVVTEDPMLLARSSHIDIILEVTGTIDYALEVILEAFKHRKHVALMNAELDGTLGPILKVYADRAGVIYTNTDGDQPGVTMNLFRFVRGIGLTPVFCGNIKGLQDPYRTPETQKAFAEKWGQKPHMVTSFADGTKISFEQAVVANATGFRVAKRGMWAPTVPAGTALEEAIKQYPTEEILKNPGFVDYIIGTVPKSGVFVLGTTDDPIQKKYLALHKIGEGPLYLFYTPYHTCNFEVPTTLARVVIFGDGAVVPKNKPYVEVVTIAKKDLKSGETIDGMGGFTVYGECENAETARKENLLPIAFAEDLMLKRDIAKDQAVTLEDIVSLPTSSSWKLWEEQQRLFKNL
ncbi:NAD(P)-dependent oxidoreductase [Candidatus Gottesmanbacteria bacterium RIFCSPHIGHO2_01_FULL_46_14]|uniref:NAD(P)-dependent oxidoreductase n=3 Tax=Microgenomates group TaxID=1794810 RepID=A0A1F5ZQH6_9BACT|nr:MAG: hypothetical protein UU34_C0006G0010 [Candidatus Curtissbacteria bacterium GW2011_GWA1_41_11]OGG14698.1 MAG: NAD(P)-dependent oxidoreductase [Candidatus Gottesmanbacteria bacterium RIFCSPHIGHO2_01_FULL_46_14]OGG29955.1 MAG: NAD(P)-dependent oxidoreductase [Candidatus Gottesmanbacteria bacterium RIFCSPLOWO2_01_FULL_46_21]